MVRIFICIFLFETAIGIANSSTMMFGKNVYGMQFMTMYGLSYTECRRACERRPSCASIDYTRRSLNCDMNPQMPATLYPAILVTRPGSVHTRVEDKQVNCGDSVCTDLQVCDLETGSCVFKECRLLVETQNMILLGNMLHIGAKAMLKCTNKAYAIQTQCQPNGKWKPDQINC